MVFLQRFICPLSSPFPASNSRAFWRSNFITAFGALDGLRGDLLPKKNCAALHNRRRRRRKPGAWRILKFAKCRQGHFDSCDWPVCCYEAVQGQGRPRKTIHATAESWCCECRRLLQGVIKDLHSTRTREPIQTTLQGQRKRAGCCATF